LLLFIFILFFFVIIFNFSGGIGVEDEGLLFKEQRLQDDGILKSYNIDKRSTIEVIEPLQNIQINVKTPSGKSIPLDMNVGDSIRAVKKIVSDYNIEN
jgi:hypothetical protein